MKAYFFSIILITLSVFSTPIDVHGSNNKVDSLTRIITNPDSEDTSLVRALFLLGEHGWKSNPDTALILFNQALKIAQRTGFKEYESEIHSWIGYLMQLKGNSEKALAHHNKNLELEIELGDSLGISYCYNNIGSVYEDQGLVLKALDYYDKSLKIKEQVNDKQGIAYSLNNIGMLYLSQQEFKKCKEYLLLSLALRKEIGDVEGTATCFNNLGLTFQKKENYDSALVYFLKCLEIDEQVGNRYGIAHSLNIIGMNYYFMKAYEDAKTYLFKSLAIREELGDKRGIAESLSSIGKIYIDQQDYPNGKRYALRSMGLAQELGNVNRIREVSELLYMIYKKEGQFQPSLEMFEQYITMRDSINNEKTQKATIRQQTKYEFEKAQLIAEQTRNEELRVKSEELRRRDNLQYSVVLICLLIIGILVAMLGRLSLPIRVAEGLIFFAFLILFEFILVLADPYVDVWTGGAPGLKLLINAGVAAFIFPLHSFFEAKLKKRIAK